MVLADTNMLNVPRDNPLKRKKLQVSTKAANSQSALTTCFIASQLFQSAKSHALYACISDIKSSQTRTQYTSFVQRKHITACRNVVIQGFLLYEDGGTAWHDYPFALDSTAPFTVRLPCLSFPMLLALHMISILALVSQMLLAYRTKEVI